MADFVESGEEGGDERGDSDPNRLRKKSRSEGGKGEGKGKETSGEGEDEEELQQQQQQQKPQQEQKMKKKQRQGSSSAFPWIQRLGGGSDLDEPAKKHGTTNTTTKSQTGDGPRRKSEGATTTKDTNGNDDDDDDDGDRYLQESVAMCDVKIQARTSFQLSSSYRTFPPPQNQQQRQHTRVWSSSTSANDRPSWESMALPTALGLDDLLRDDEASGNDRGEETSANNAGNGSVETHEERSGTAHSSEPLHNEKPKG